jgi:hypothetical protein
MADALLGHLCLLCVIFNRGVRAIIRGKHGILRFLQCGLGMGGPASPFLWNLAHDPLVTGLAVTLRIACLTYVDDLCALTVGLVQVTRLFLLFLAAGQAAGLVTDVHKCSWLTARFLRDRAARVLHALPVVVSQTCPDSGMYTVTGIPGDLSLAILTAALGSDWAAGSAVVRIPCT